MGSPHTLITCIINKGNGKEVMKAARKAGASGGTIIDGMGTGSREDALYLGVSHNPDKEILYILVGSGETGKVLEAIRNTPCLAEKGSGIAFCSDVDRFMLLGEA